MRQLIALLLITVVFGLFSAGCDLRAAQGEPAVVSAGETIGDLGAPMTKYKGGLPYAPKARYANLTSEYNDWKAHYITSSGAGGYEKCRVQRDAASDYDTVSEGIGYGMLLAVYFNDQLTFDLLYAYARSHFVKSNVPLMHWKVDKNNKNVSEFNDYEKETKGRNITVSGNRSASNYRVSPKSVAEVPHGLVYFNKSTGKVFILKTEAELNAQKAGLYNAAKAVFDKDTNYYAGCEWPREFSSAADADVDMAAALCFASRKWGTGFWDYTSEADKMLKAIRRNDFESNFLKNGNLWGDKACWNSSYFTPAYYSCVFYPFYKEHTELSGYTTERDFWRYLSNYIYPEMEKLRADSVKGLWPDWCDTSNRDGRVRPSQGSDRHYIINGKNKKQMSYNFYYDAVRTPWRLATANSWIGNPNNTGEHYKQLATAMDFFKEVGIKNVVDGYSRWGGTWVEAYRDGFNLETGGVSNSVTFVAMIATLSLPSFDKTWADECWDWVVYKKERYTDAHNYYGNTLRLLSLLYLSGQFVNIYQK